MNCDVCLRSKLTNLPFPKESNRSTKLLEIIHSDVCGPMRVESLGRSKYFLTFTDDYSRYTEVFFIRHKSEVFQKFKDFKAKAEKLTGKILSIYKVTTEKNISIMNLTNI